MDGVHLEQDGESARRIALPAAMSILRRFNKTLEDYDKFAQEKSKDEEPLSTMKPSQRDDDMLERLLRTQHEQSARRIRSLIQNDVGASPNATNKPTVGYETDLIWASLGTDQKDKVGYTDEQSGSSWDQTTSSAYRGIRRIVKGLPERSKY